MSERQPGMINAPSVMSLFIEMYFGATKLSSGTAFLIRGPRGLALITNRHNVTGRDNNTGDPLSPTGGLPDSMVIWFAERDSGFRLWNTYRIPLYREDGSPRWFDHPSLRERGDLVAIPSEPPDNCEVFPYELTPPDEVRLTPGDTLSVIGFPFGRSAGSPFGVWSTGFLASEIAVDYDNLPMFLVDCRSRPGQSGSPVIFYRNGGSYFDSQGNYKILLSPMIALLGIYSGRINEQSDLGRVWRLSSIKELVDSI